MNGILNKIKDKWVVTYGSPAGTEIWPVNVSVHPDDVKVLESTVLGEFGQVEFEIVPEASDSVISGRYFAKLINTPLTLNEDFETKPGFIEERTEQMLEIVANEEFKNVGDDGLFPNHTDKDIWIAGFKAGFKFSNKNRVI